MIRQMKSYFVLAGLMLFFVGCSNQRLIKYDVPGSVHLDTVKAGMFDTGKMWTFDFPPMDYFAKTYNFIPKKEWFEKARLSALRLPGCTASFVSEDGLVMTNHHCARSALDSVNREGERLAEVGFYAFTLEEERRAPNIYIDQLVLMEDVTAEVQNAFETGKTDNEKVENRMAKMKDIQKRYTADFKTKVPLDSMIFSVVSFYNGGRYSLYGYKRYIDVRLVYAPEEEMGFFGGDPDNFTYPRYDFDCSFFRVYENGKPLKTSNFFQFSQTGAKEGDAVFVIGNPGSTSRLLTIAQLDFLRDVTYPASIEATRSIEKIYSEYVIKHPESRIRYINTIFGLANSRKAVTGYLNGLTDPVLMAKKQDFEKKFKASVVSNSNLKTKYGDPWSDIATYQAELAAISSELNALKFKGRSQARYLSLASDLVDAAIQAKDSIEPSLKMKLTPKNFVSEIETQILAFRLSVMNRSLGGKNEAFDKLLEGMTFEQAAKAIAASTVIGSKEKMESLLSGSPQTILTVSDPLISFFVSVRPHLIQLQKNYDAINEKLQARVQVLGRALYEVYGTTIPPDATFTLRIADGEVKGYEYNGTIAPPVTTFFGMYDRYYSFGMKEPWNLPERWVNPPASFKMGTPMNFISTNDIIGGNSGSPVIDKDLHVVGLIFDGNIESLPGNVIFEDTKNRSISVHSSGILEGLEKIYKAERIVKELRAGKMNQ
jgi:hypothetical protein